jgi:hypothetical protein
LVFVYASITSLRVGPPASAAAPLAFGGSREERVCWRERKQPPHQSVPKEPLLLNKASSDALSEFIRHGGWRGFEPSLQECTLSKRSQSNVKMSGSDLREQLPFPLLRKV